jgi:hypothetical protein
MTALRYILPFVAALAAAPVFAQTKPAAAAPTDTMQVLREKLKADKKLLVAANLDLTDAEAKKFWPVYEEYQKELNRINDQIVMVLVDYSKEFNAKTLTDAKASALFDRSLTVDDAELKARRAILPKVRAALPGIKAARYMQIENKMRAVQAYETARVMPLAR